MKYQIIWGKITKIFGCCNKWIHIKKIIEQRKRRLLSALVHMLRPSNSNEYAHFSRAIHLRSTSLKLFSTESVSFAFSKAEYTPDGNVSLRTRIPENQFYNALSVWVKTNNFELTGFFILLLFPFVMDHSLHNGISKQSEMMNAKKTTQSIRIGCREIISLLHLRSILWLYFLWKTNCVMSNNRHFRNLECFDSW